MTDPRRAAGTSLITAMRILAAVLLLTLPVDSAFPDPGFRVVAGPCDFRFPEDHGAHPGFRTEWWYYTGNVQTDGGRRFGYQLTFFRSQMAPSIAKTRWPAPASGWRTLQIYLAHAALSDIREDRHFQAEAMFRSALGMAGAEATESGSRVFLKNWSAEIDQSGHALTAEADDFSLALVLTPCKPPVAHGDAGYSRKGRDPEQASCYYSLTRLHTAGAIAIDGDAFPVSGLSWMDHEFSTAPLAEGVVGWDWFSLQLTDGTELMAYFLREPNGRFHPASSATFVNPEGKGAHIASGSIRLETTATWESPETGATYPSGWTLSTAAPDLVLSISPTLADQEMQTPLTTDVVYWEGAVSVTGTAGGRPVEGNGYVELTGYDRAFDAPM